MMLQTWRQWLSHQPRTSRRTPAGRPKRFRPRVDLLEERLVLSQRTWTGFGADNKWSTPDNWNLVNNQAIAPAAGDELIFPAGAFQNSNSNDFVDRNFLSITFQSGGYSVSGNKVLLGNGALGASPQITATTGNVDFGPDIDLLSNVVGGQFRFTAGSGATLTLGGVITGAANESVRKEGVGKVVFDAANQYQGTTTVVEGILSITNDSSLGAAGSASAGTSLVDGATLDIQGGLTLTEDLTLVGKGVQPLAGSGALRNVAGDNVWNGPITLLPNAAGDLAVVSLSAGTLTINGTVGGSGGLGTAGTGELVLTAANTFAGEARLFGTVEIQNAQALGSTAAGTFATNLVLATPSGVPSLDVGAEALQIGKLQSRTGNNSWAGSITMLRGVSGDSTIEVDAGSQLTISGSINDNSSTGLEAGLTKVGAGKLVLTAANTYRLFTHVEEGVLTVGHKSALGPSNSFVSVSGSAVLELQPGLVMDPYQLDLDVSFGNPTPGTLRSLGGNTEWKGGVDIQNGAIIVVDGATLTLSGPVEGGFSSSNLTKEGPGTLAFTGSAANSLTGVTTVNEGTLFLNKSPGVPAITDVGATSNAKLIIGDGLGGANADVVRLGANQQLPNDNIYQVIVKGSGLLDLNGFNDDVGPLVLEGGNVTTGTGTLSLRASNLVGITSNAASTVATISGKLNLGNISRSITVADDGTDQDDLLISAAVNSNVAATGTAFEKKGAGKLVLGAANTIAGTATVSEGVLTVRNGTAVAGVSVANVAALELDGGISVNGSTTVSLTGAGPSGTGALRSVNGINTLARDVNLSGNVTVNVVSSTLTMSGTLGSGGSGLTKIGSGALVLTGNNTAFDDPITLNAGTLRVNGPLPGAVVTANSGTTLEGNSTVGPVTLNSATLSPAGVQPGTLASNGNVVFNGSSTFRVDVNSGFHGTFSDRLSVTPGVSLVVLNNASLVPDVTLATGFTLRAGDRLRIIDNQGSDAIIGTFAQGSAISAGKVDFNIVYNGGDGNDVDLVVRRINVGTAPMVTDVALTPQVTEGGVATLSGRLVDPDAADQLFLDVDWDDGTVETFTPGRDAFAFSHRYLDDGQHTVRFLWRDDLGLSNSDSRAVTVTNAAPQLSDVKIASAAVIKKDVVLSGQILDAGVRDAHTLTVKWGDGKTDVFQQGAGASAFRATHRYRKPGKYTIVLTLSDDDGGVVTKTTRLVVRRKGVSKRTSTRAV
jgi:fibronectin-binding autotransporter adhesin